MCASITGGGSSWDQPGKSQNCFLFSFLSFLFFLQKPNLSQTSKYNINREQSQHVSDRGEAGFVGFVSTS